ncbi:hypothetical protein AAAT94_05370 [Intestinimonas aquisgranensis]|nr:hypothetical protein [Intestinimonas aquisgranensis]
MKKCLRPLPVRVQLVLSLVLLVLTFFLAWWASGWAWPTRGLAYRALETAHGFGPGEIVAQGEISFEKGYSNQSGADYSAWMAGRFGDSFAFSVLEQAPGPLWRGNDPLCYAFQVLTPTEETPLAAALLAQADGPFGRRPVGTPFLFHSEYLWAICTLDPAIVRVEVTMNYTYRLGTDVDFSDPMESDPVTAQAQPMAEGVWLARVRLPDPLEGRGGVYSTNHSIRGYDADGVLIYDSGLS